MAIKDVQIGDRAPQIVNMVIENPRGSRLKIEHDPKTDTFVLDRVHQTHLGSPTDYGFVPQTLDEDGDALDVLVISDDPLPTGLVVPMRVLGVMYMVDDGEVDNKLIGVIADDKSKEHIQSVDDLGELWQRATQHYFEHYKDLKGGKVEVKGFAGFEQASKVLAECIERAKADSAG